MHWKFVFAALIIAATIPLPAQDRSHAIFSSLQVNTGLGWGVYHDDFEGAGIMEGPTLWFDIYPNKGPNLLKGFGLDLEARDISFGRPPTAPSNTSPRRRHSTACSATLPRPVASYTTRTTAWPGGSWWSTRRR